MPSDPNLKLQIATNLHGAIGAIQIMKGVGLVANKKYLNLVRQLFSFGLPLAF